MIKGESVRAMKRGGIREQYLTLAAKRPLTPLDIRRLETLMLLMVRQKAQNDR